MSTEKHCQTWKPGTKIFQASNWNSPSQAFVDFNKQIFYSCLASWAKLVMISRVFAKQRLVKVNTILIKQIFNVQCQTTFADLKYFRNN